MRLKHRELRDKAVQYGGGQCQLCGYKKCVSALEFHHRNPLEKDFNPSRGYKLRWAALKAELDKCVLVCANCHREIHAGVVQLA